MTMDTVRQLDGAHVLVYSLGIEGRDLAQWLVRQGAHVTISDTRSERELERAGAKVPTGVQRVVTGQPLLDPEGFDLLAVSQSILRHDATMQRAREKDVPVTSQMRLFMQLCPGRMVGITGSAGKSTTTSLVGAMADAAGLNAIVGGNIGQALLERLDEIGPDSTVILEISHTQLQYTDRSPSIAAITNVTPNHLDQFSWDEYVGLKRRLLEYQGPDDIAVLNMDDRTSHGLMPSVRGQLRQCSILETPEGDGAYLAFDEIVCADGRKHVRVAKREDVQLRGEHNMANVVMASAIGYAMGLSPDEIQRGIAGFRGVPHRLEPVGVAGGVAYINDSIATAPERTIAGLRSFAEPVVLLLGGRDKKLPLESLAREVGQRCREVVCFGESAELFLTGMRETGLPLHRSNSMDDAVALASQLARPGEVVLLAPAGTSFDAYPSFEARGEAFRQIVRALPGFQGVQ